MWKWNMTDSRCPVVYGVFLAGDMVQGVDGDVDRQIDGTQHVHVMGVIQNPNQCNVMYSIQTPILFSCQREYSEIFKILQ